MSASDLEPISLDRFLWLEAFAARLHELGAPASPERLTQLGHRLYDRNTLADPRAVADAIWARWPTDSGVVASD
jgi:hypothetical protein